MVCTAPAKLIAASPMSGSRQHLARPGHAPPRHSWTPRNPLKAGGGCSHARQVPAVGGDTQHGPWGLVLCLARQPAFRRCSTWLQALMAQKIRSAMEPYTLSCAIISRTWRLR